MHGRDPPPQGLDRKICRAQLGLRQPAWRCRVLSFEFVTLFTALEVSVFLSYSWMAPGH